MRFREEYRAHPAGIVVTATRRSFFFAPFRGRSLSPDVNPTQSLFFVFHTARPRFYC